jgi:hypothetical protein
VMEYFVKRVLPVSVISVLGGGYYGIHRFIKYLDNQACSRNVPNDREKIRQKEAGRLLH